MVPQWVIFVTNFVIFRGRLKCFYYEIYSIELRCEWVNTKNLEFFHGMLLHSSVAMETRLVNSGHILKIARATI